MSTFFSVTSAKRLLNTSVTNTFIISHTVSYLVRELKVLQQPSHRIDRFSGLQASLLSP